MKNRLELRLALGMSQYEMAEMLNVSRTLFSMYEIGKRNLPLSALQMLGELQEHLQASHERQSRQAKDAATNIRKKELERLLKDNLLAYHTLERKKDLLIKKHNATASRVEIKDFQFKNSQPNWPLVLPKKLTPDDLSNCQSKLIHLEIQLELLEHGRKWIESQLASKG
jgi:transcriptional regulator with XRE-family HTH domain